MNTVYLVIAFTAILIVPASSECPTDNICTNAEQICAGDPKACIDSPCKDEKCNEQGTCTVEGPETANPTAKCTCNPGFTGDECETGTVAGGTAAPGNTTPKPGTVAGGTAAPVNTTPKPGTVAGGTAAPGNTTPKPGNTPGGTAAPGITTPKPATTCSLAAGCVVPTGDDEGCSKLKAYINCFTAANTTTFCYPESGVQTKIAVTTKCEPETPCKCQVGYWHDVDAQSPCTAVKELQHCMSEATDDEKGCNGESKAKINEVADWSYSLHRCTSGSGVLVSSTSVILAVLLAFFSL